MRNNVCFVTTFLVNCALNLRAFKAFYRQSILSVAIEKKTYIHLCVLIVSFGFTVQRTEYIQRCFVIITQ